MIRVSCYNCFFCLFVCLCSYMKVKQPEELAFNTFRHFSALSATRLKIGFASKNGPYLQQTHCALT